MKLDTVPFPLLPPFDACDYVEMELDKRRSRRFAAWCARRCYPLWAKEFPDDLRPLAAIKTAEWFADLKRATKGNIERLAQAYKAAHDAPKRHKVRFDSPVGCSALAAGDSADTRILLVNNSLYDTWAASGYSSQEKQRLNQLQVWFGRDVSLPRTTRTVCVARQILVDGEWFPDTTMAFCDAILEDDGVPDDFWLVGVLKHPLIVNMPVIGVRFLEDLATQDAV